MIPKGISRRLFVLGGGAVASGIAHPSNSLSSAEGGSPRITPMLYGDPLQTTNLEGWFGSMKQWGVRQWMSFAVPFHPRHGRLVSSGIPFLKDVLPGFTPHLDLHALADEEAAIRKVAGLTVQNGMEFWYMIPFPLFPSRDGTVVEKVAPQFFKGGRVNFYDPRLAELLRAEIRTLKKALPDLKGVNLWLAEGSGGVGDITAQELQRNKEWEKPLIAAFNEVIRELDIGGILFAHHYLHTVRTHRNVYEMMADFPELILMDDITWPEEDMLHPFLGYLPQSDRRLFFQTNPTALNFLLDTEYIGEGILPSVYPRWWQHNIREAARNGAQIAMGRTFFWDGGYTDINFNRLNAHMFASFCYNPDADTREVFNRAAREMFGNRVPARLLDVLWETEPIIKDVIGINGVDSLGHSRFPRPIYIDVVYTPQGNAMKAVDDLFSPPGTALYPPLTDGLNNYKQWRWQNKTISKPAAEYITRKKKCVSWIEGILPDVHRLSVKLKSNHRKLFVQGYELLAALAKGMVLFVETAHVHHEWAHAKSISDQTARLRFRELAERFRAQAAQTPKNPFLYQERMTAFAEFIERDLPRIGRDADKS